VDGGLKNVTGYQLPVTRKRQKENTMSWVDDLLREFPFFSVAREKLVALETRFSAMEKELVRMREENGTLKRDLATMDAKATESSVPPEFVDASGMLWKSGPGGGFESVPYCPTCKSPLSDVSGSLLCLKCNWQAPLKSFEVPKMYHDLFGGK
jgi:hypothetical protein